MTQANNTVSNVDLYVDPYTLELFTNYNLERTSTFMNTADVGDVSAVVSADPANYETARKLLVEDAEEFIETIARDFPGISINSSAEAYAHQFLRNAMQ
jgi:hypothetical protein|tara:strand:- start:6338 stop:6634 length:297 start_codon:yes stop_codon:yes gene_type:complete